MVRRASHEATAASSIAQTQEAALSPRLKPGACAPQEKVNPPGHKSPLLVLLEETLSGLRCIIPSHHEVRSRPRLQVFEGILGCHGDDLLDTPVCLLATLLLLLKQIQSGEAKFPNT